MEYVYEASCKKFPNGQTRNGVRRHVNIASRDAAHILFDGELAAEHTEKGGRAVSPLLTQISRNKTLLSLPFTMPTRNARITEAHPLSFAAGPL